MTDQQMHERLAAAGDRWREAQPSDVPEPRIDLPRVPVVRRPTAWLVSAAAVAAAVIALVVALAWSRGAAPRPVLPMNPSSIEGVRWVDPSMEYIWPPGTHLRPRSYQYSYKRPESLHIATKGRVTGFDGCDAFSARARVTGRYIYFGHLAKNAVRPCTKAGPARQAFMVDTFLTGRVHWQLICGQLWLTKPHRGEVDWTNSSIPDPSPAMRAQVSCMQRWSRAHS